MRKVKYTQQNFHDKLTQILDDFPKLEVRNKISVVILQFHLNSCRCTETCLSSMDSYLVL